MTKNIELAKKNEGHLRTNEEEIQLITERVLEKITEKIKSEILEPKKPVITHKEYSLGIMIFGYFLLAMCILYWFYFFFIAQEIVPLTHTTYITLILISVTCINKFESVLLNSFTSLSFIGFLAITILLIPVTKNVFSLFGGVILHGAMAAFQFYLVFHKKIAVSKRYLIIGLLFYIVFLSNYDSMARLIAITETENVLSEIMTAVQVFYVLILSTIAIYFYKKKWGIIVP